MQPKNGMQVMLYVELAGAWQVAIAKSVSSLTQKVRTLGPGKTVQIYQGVIVPAQPAVNAVKAVDAAVLADHMALTH